MNNKDSKKGFTLIELLTVIIIIGVLSAIAMPSYFSNVEMAKAREAINFVREWKNAREIYFSNNEHYISATADVEVLGMDPISNGVNDYFENFFAYFGDVAIANNAQLGAVSLKRKDNSYFIYGTDYDIFCCYGDSTKGEKTCKSLSSSDQPADTDTVHLHSNLTQTSTPTCYLIGISD